MFLDDVGDAFGKAGNKLGGVLDKTLQRIDRMNEAATKAFEGIGDLLNSPVLLVIGGCVVLYIITQA